MYRFGREKDLGFILKEVESLWRNMSRHNLHFNKITLAAMWSVNFKGIKIEDQLGGNYYGYFCLKSNALS